MCQAEMLACFVHFDLEVCFLTSRVAVEPRGFWSASSCWKRRCGPTFCTLGLKANGFLFRMFFLESLMAFSFCSVLWQFTQLQDSSQNLPSVKHSQYILRHLDLLHLQLKFYTVVDFFLMTVNYLSSAIEFFLSWVFLPKPLVFLLVSVSGEFPRSPFWDYLNIESFDCCLAILFWALLSRFFRKVLDCLFGDDVLLTESNLPVSSFLLSCYGSCMSWNFCIIIRLCYSIWYWSM